MPLMPDAWVAQSAAATKKTNNSSRRKRVAELSAWKVLSGLDFAKKKSKGGVFVDDDQTSLQRARSRYQQAKRYAKSIISAATWEEDSQTVVRQMFNCDVNSGGMRSRCFLTTVEIEELRDVIAEAHEADEIELDGTEDVGTFEELLSNFDDNSHELVNLHRQRQESLMVYVLCLAQNGYKTESMKQRGDCLAMPKLPTQSRSFPRSSAKHITVTELFKRSGSYNSHCCGGTRLKAKCIVLAARSSMLTML